MRQNEYTTAGGVVLDEAGRVLLIERTVTRDGCERHEVRLPKGHIDPGESAEEAARREVFEETGYRGVEIRADLGLLHNEYDYGGSHWLRHERYFLMELTDPAHLGNQSPDPSSEEARFVCRWVEGFDAAEDALTYESEREFIRRARQALDAG